MRRACEQPYESERDAMARLAALLPSERDLDRLIRYEAHVERSLSRNLELLAKLRGATVESTSALVAGHLPNGASVQLRGTRT